MTNFCEVINNDNICELSSPISPSSISNNILAGYLGILYIGFSFDELSTYIRAGVDVFAF